MKVFISHSSKDKPAVEALAAALHGRGIEVWLDKYEMGTGDNFVAKINDGLEQAAAGIIVFSRHSRDSRWVEAEVTYLTHARIEEGKVLVPVRLGDDAYVPPLLCPYLHRGIDEVDAIVDALHQRKPRPAPVRAPEHGRQERVLISLRREGGAGIRTEVRIGDAVYGQAAVPAMPRALAEAQAAFLQGFRPGLQRDQGDAQHRSSEIQMAQLGSALAALCFPAGSGAALADLVDGSGSLTGTTVEVCWEADTPELLGLPFEAACLPDGRVLALQPSVVMLRRPAGLKSTDGEALAGPLKILVAVAAPDEDVAASFALDQERELQNILDAVEPARRHENCDVRILEVALPKVIGEAIAADAHHVLHLSCHGLPGALELEDEEGRAVRTVADALLAPIRAAGRPLPLVLLSACHTGVAPGQTASLAEALLRGGIPAVVAMQAPVSDHYATRLAKSFYMHLARRENFLPSRALADARREEERQRHEAVQRGAPLHETQPEFATAALYVAGEERPVADFALDRRPLKARPVYDVPGPVPQFRIDDLIGRRKELRDTPRSLRDPGRQYAGVVLTGIGGAGKSAVAGRVMCRLAEDGWMVAAHRGRFDLAGIAAAVGAALTLSRGETSRQCGALLVQANLDDRMRLAVLGQALAEEPLLLVLDDFEANLTTGGDRFLDDDAAMYVRGLAQQARRGRLLVTCRHPVPGTEAFLRRVAIGPLSPAETRKLLMRLKGLSDAVVAASNLAATTATVLRAVGGHPRALEFLDALMRGGEARFPAVAEKLRRIADERKLDLSAPPESLDEAVRTARAIAAGDVLLEELLAIARREGIADVLLQAAVSNLPVTPAGVARMLAEDGPGDVQPISRAIDRLESLSLLHRFPGGAVFVHRWTAEVLGSLEDAASHQARAARAGHCRRWQVQNESHDLGDAIEAVRNFLAARAFDEATGVADACFDAFRRFQQSTGIAALAAEVLETLPESHPGFGAVADEEAQARLALGLIDRAFERHRQVLRLRERLAQAEPGRADYQRDLSVSYERIGDLFRVLGKGDDARQAFAKALAIRERLAQAEPGRADYQRDLSVSYNKMGDLFNALGQGDEAQQAFAKALAIRERLAQAEPGRADYQRDLSVSYNKMGDLFRALGQGDEARQAFAKALAIAERLAQAEPGRADYQRDLITSLVKMSETDARQTREHLSRALDIARTLREQGRLAPVDAWMVDDLARRLDGITATKNSAGPSLVGSIWQWLRRRGS
jgi:tetratricopeptide (TPR) repeat protein